MTGQTTATPMPEDQVNAAKDQLYIGGPFLNYQAKGNKVELLGREDLNGVNAYKLKVTNSANMESTYYIDPTTYYILKNISKVSVQGQDVETSVLFSNYQKTDFGYVLPYTTEMTLSQGFSIKSTTKKVEINKPVADSVFKAG